MRNDRADVLSWRAAGVPGDQQPRLTAACSSTFGRAAERPPRRVYALWHRQDDQGDQGDQDGAQRWPRDQVRAEAARAFPAQTAGLGL